MVVVVQLRVLREVVEALVEVVAVVVTVVELVSVVVVSLPEDCEVELLAVSVVQ